ALGTSLPELAASIVAVKHNQTGFVIGNIIGSNIINIVAVLGFTLIIRPITIEFADMMIHGLFMIILTIGLFMLIKFKGGITKFYAGILLFIYLLFIYFNFQIGVETIL
ncbi:MAG: sodium:calcium antiporter, partial [Candidatus Marinimicrobia bacterium]|nr:sodium:calcium antiporter [Candidatus Neomarinimicrobiota bacterium]